MSRDYIKELEAEVEELLSEYNESICEYEDALEHPDFYDVELAKEVMEENRRWYEEAKDRFECEMAWKTEWEKF